MRGIALCLVYLFFRIVIKFDQFESITIALLFSILGKINEN